jgi:hypothetical protein
MATIVEEFDAIAFKNASVQFKDTDGTHSTGEKFGAVGSIEGETTLVELIKNAEGTEVKKTVKPQKVDLTISAHVKVAVIRNIFGISNKDLKPGIYSYSTESKGKEFIFTADVIDEFEDITKLVAFPNCVSASGFSFSIENGASEVAELSVSLTAYPDDNKQIMYEAYVSELDDQTVSEQWHTAFTRTLVEAVPVV